MVIHSLEGAAVRNLCSSLVLIGLQVGFLGTSACSEDAAQETGGTGASASVGPGGGPPSAGIGGGGASFLGAGGGAVCVNLECKKVVCDSGKVTSISGIVHTPRVDAPDPLYNAVVYIPNSTVEPFSPGVSCDKCGAPASGSPLVSALTGSDGSFVLNDVPVSENLPLVIQIGRWRRQVSIPTVTACAENSLPDDLTRLPRNQSEGDIPSFAIASGDSDKPECVLRKIGIEDSEFTLPGGGGRVQIFQGVINNPPSLGPGTPTAGALWNDLATLEKYDIVLLPCEGNEIQYAVPMPPQVFQNMLDYTAAGGRIFATHFSYIWMKSAPPPWSTIVNWAPTAGWLANQPATINMSFPKGQAMAEWLQSLGATTTLGVIDTLLQPRYDVESANADALVWMTSSDPSAPSAVQHFSFNTPVGAARGEACGRVVFNDFHVVDIFGGSTGIFPEECTDSGPMTPQERVLEFMLFDLASCVQLDDKPPIEPPK